MEMKVGTRLTLWKMHRKKWMFLIVLFIVVVTGMLFRAYFLQKMADVLSVESNAAKSDVIIVLGGEKLGERTERAVELYREGMAPCLLFSDGTALSWRIQAVEEMTLLGSQARGA